MTIKNNFSLHLVKLPYLPHSAQKESEHPKKKKKNINPRPNWQNHPGNSGKQKIPRKSAPICEACIYTPHSILSGLRIIRKNFFRTHHSLRLHARTIHTRIHLPLPLSSIHSSTVSTTRTLEILKSLRPTRKIFNELTALSPLLFFPQLHSLVEGAGRARAVREQAAVPARQRGESAALKSPPGAQQSTFDLPGLQQNFLPQGMYIYSTYIK